MATKSKAKSRRKTNARKSPSRPKTRPRTRDAVAPDLKKMLAMLEGDHSKVDKLFKRYEKLKNNDDESRFDLVPTVCNALKIHTAIEEELLYPGARDVLGNDEDMIDEAEVEHASAKQLIADLDQMDPGDSLYDAKFKVLGEYVQHHVKEEEEKMFPKLRKKSETQFEGLLVQMEHMRQTLESDLQIEAKTSKNTENRATAPARGSAALQ
jgi:hemerythrin-like domain-containing protein